MTGKDNREWSSSESRKDEKISASELVRFLRRLATLYRDPSTGNPAMSDALAELADGLSKRRHGSIRERAADIAGPTKRPQPIPESELRNLSPEDIEKVVSDDKRSKTELIELGLIRFGISRSRLVKMSKADVVDAIRSALRHEESLRIISQEAQRGGNTRSS